MATITARRRRAVEHLIVTDYARDRLARAAFDAIADGLDLGPLAVRTPADRAWVRDAIAGPIQRLADHALDSLAVDLVDELDTGRPDLVARLLAPAGEAGGFDPASSRPSTDRRPGTGRTRMHRAGRSGQIRRPTRPSPGR
jgi:hypothetical protein